MSYLDIYSLNIEEVFKKIIINKDFSDHPNYINLITYMISLRPDLINQIDPNNDDENNHLPELIILIKKK